jgi:hypothetical protein
MAAQKVQVEKEKVGEVSPTLQYLEPFFIFFSDPMIAKQSVNIAKELSLGQLRGWKAYLLVRRIT